MSIGASILGLYAFFQNEGILDGVGRVAELGSMEYEVKQAETQSVFELFFKRKGFPVPTGINPETGMSKGGAMEFYNNMGWDYVALDLDGRFGSRVFDLNHDELPQDLIGWADLTTNLGTGEHVFDQAHCFRITHEITKPGGLMLHLMPSQNMPRHGLYQYSACLYNSLAHYNDYEIIGQWLSTLDQKFWLPASAKTDLVFAYKKVIVTLLRRRGDAPFVVPLQVNAPQVPDTSALARNYNASFEYSGEYRRPTYDVAFAVDFDTLETRKLTMDEVMAEEKWRAIAEGAPKSLLYKMRDMKQVLERQREVIARLEADAAKRNATVSARLKRRMRSLRSKVSKRRAAAS